MKPEWRNILNNNCYFYSTYNCSERSRFEQILMTFLNNTRFKGYGIEINDKIKVTIAGWAMRMLTKLPLGAHYFSHVETVKVYPGSQLNEDAVGLMENGICYCHISLAWGDIRKDIKHPKKGSNTVLHEFAHALDLLDRKMDGSTPIIFDKKEIKQWQSIFSSDFILNNPRGKKIWSYLGLSRWRKYNIKTNSSVLTSEMFAVSTEKYFEDTRRLKKIAPEIFRQLNLLYKQSQLNS